MQATEYSETAKQAWKDCKAGNTLISISCAEQGAKYTGQATKYAAVQATEYAETAKQAWKDCKAGNTLISISCAEQPEQGAMYSGQATE